MKTSAVILASALTLTCASAVLVPRARAQETATAAEAPAPDLTDEEARGLFQAGRSAYAAGRFEDALGYFQNAYDLSSRPVLLFNIGQTLDRLRRDREALETFERFLELVPDADNRAQVEARIEILRESTRRSEAATGEREASSDGDEVDPSDGEDATPTEAESGGSLRGPMAWATAGGALVFGALAGTFWALGHGEYDDLEASCGGHCTSAEIDASSLHTYDVLTNVWLALSVASAATSVTLFILDARGDDTANDDALSLRLTPAGLRLEGSF